MRIFVVTLLCLFLSAPVGAEQHPAVCRHIADLEDANALGSQRILAKPFTDVTRTGVQLDLDGDGTNENLKYAADKSNILIDGTRLKDIAPEYRSVSASHDGLIQIDGEYFGIIRNADFLTMVWRFAKDPETNSLKGVPVCFFDREWTETQRCSAYATEYYTRIEPNRPEHFNVTAKFEKLSILDAVFGRKYYGIIPYAAPIEIDYDNDKATELVGTIVLKLKSPRYSKFIETPVVLTPAEPSEIADTFQNQRIVQYFAREGSSGSRISFLIPKQKYGNVLIDEQFIPKSLGVGAPQKPFRKVYRIHDNWPETLCEADFEWKTVFTTNDLR